MHLWFDRISGNPARRYLLFIIVVSEEQDKINKNSSSSSVSSGSISCKFVSGYFSLVKF